MTQKLSHNIPAGITLRLDINGNTVKEYTVPDGKLLHVAATEVAIFDAGTHIEVYAGGTKKLDYTVPPGFAVLVETLLQEVFD